MSEIKPDNGFLQGQILNDKFYSSFMFDCRRCNKKYIYFQEDYWVMISFLLKYFVVEVHADKQKLITKTFFRPCKSKIENIFK